MWALDWKLKKLMIDRVTCDFGRLMFCSLLDPESEASQANVMQLPSMLPRGSDSECAAVSLKTRFIFLTILDPPCCCWEDWSSKIVPICPCGTVSLMLRTDQIELAELRSAAGDEDRIWCYIRNNKHRTVSISDCNNSWTLTEISHVVHLPHPLGGRWAFQSPVFCLHLLPEPLLDQLLCLPDVVRLVMSV